jgi:hypothetical protein
MAYLERGLATTWLEALTRNTGNRATRNALVSRTGGAFCEVATTRNQSLQAWNCRAVARGSGVGAESGNCLASTASHGRGGNGTTAHCKGHSSANIAPFKLRDALLPGRCEVNPTPASTYKVDLHTASLVMG